ncbi:unnamed protein product [Euphydryas editha]|uniref:Reverse transcriptase domain-containing protein n=1 Tax=Euphydryas editha TaxID=104508 RepID=A0AAU9UX73_EUPED|nr:unnamed protein product [Euphydryas editha]
MDSRSATGWDNIPTVFLKRAKEIVVPVISDLINLSFEKGDTAIVFAGDTWYSVRKTTELGLAKMAKWLNENLLTLNTSKTNYVCFAKLNNTQPTPEFIIKIHRCPAAI